jgi:hypothetical protein
VPPVQYNYDTLPPYAANLRLYNAPRLIEANIAQNQDGDGTYEKTLYTYIIGGGIYPYNPENNTEYPSGGATTREIGSKGTIKVVLRFSEAMAINSANYNLKLIHINPDGSDGTQIGFDDTAWSFENAPGATLTGTATIPEDFPDGTARLAVRASRLAVPPGLDTNNQGLDLDGDGSSTLDAVDRSVAFTIGNADTTPPQIHLEDFGHAYTVPPNNTLETAPWLIGPTSDPLFSLSDSGSGLQMFALFNTSGELVSWEWYEGVASAQAQVHLPADAAGYILYVGDRAGNESKMYFHVDRHAPKVEYSSVSVRGSGNFYAFDVYGTASDGAAGIGAGPTLVPDGGVMDVHPTGAAYPPGPLSKWFSFPGLAGNSNYAFVAADNADNIGKNELWLTNVSETLTFGSSNGSKLGHWHSWETPSTYHEGEAHLQGIASGRTITGGSVATKVPSVPGCTISGEPAGMSAKVTLKDYIPEGSEVHDSDWDNIPLKLDYTLSNNVSVQSDTPGQVVFSEALPWRMPRYMALALETKANTSPMTLTCDGVASEIPAGTMYYDVAVKLDTTWTSIVAPRVIYEEVVTPDLNVVVRSGVLETGIEKVTEAGRITISKAKYDVTIPGYRIGGDGYVYNVHIGAKYAGNVRVRISVNMTGLTDRQKENISIYHDDGTGWKNSTMSRGADFVEYVGPTASPFVVMVPVDDSVAPQTLFSVIGSSAVVDAKFYMQSSARVELEAEDFAADPTDISGVATTYYIIDGEFTPSCLATTYNPDATRGTCANPVYAGPFPLLPEGVHTVGYFSVDNAGNPEQAQYKTFYVDATAPQATAYVNGSPVAAGGSAFMTAASSITITAGDVVSGEVSSGFYNSFYLIDTTLADCGQLGPIVSTAPAGSCQNYLYTGPFSLVVGTHTVSCTAMDKVGNLAPPQSIFVTVSAGDVTPPQTALGFTGPRAEAIGDIYLSTSAAISILPFDAESGVATTYYLLDADPGTSVGLEYSAPFSLEEGSHTLHYRAVDKAGIYELWKSTIVYIDGTGPASWYSITGLAMAIDGHNYVSLNSTVSVGALDPEVKGAASGVGELYFSVDGAQAVVGSQYAVIPSSEGIHDLGYYAVDKLDNIGAAGAYTWRVDATAPVTWYEVAGTSYTAGGLLYLKAGAPLFFQRTDPVSNGVASGAQDTWYSLDTGVDAPYGMMPLILSEGPHMLGYFSGDKAGNYELRKTTAVFVDGTAPVLALKAARAVYSETNAYYGTSRDTFTVSAADAGCGLRSLEISLNDGAFLPAAGGVFDLSFASEGRNKVVARALDNLGNEGGATYYLIIDDTPPDFSGSRQIKWEAEDPSNTITPAGSLVLADGGLKLYGGVTISTNQHTVLYSGDSLPALSTPAWGSSIMGTPYTVTETVSNGIYSVSGAGNGGNGVVHWRSEPYFIPSKGWSYEMRARVTTSNWDNSSGFYVGEGNGYYIWLQFRYSYIWLSLVPGGDMYINLDGWNFHSGKLAREGDYIRFYLDGVLKASALYPAPVGLPTQPSERPFLNSFSVSYGNFGGEMDWLKYTCYTQDTVAAGALNGTFETPFIPLGEVSTVRNFTASSAAGDGSLKYEYTTDGGTYKDVSRLNEVDVAVGRVKLRATLTRAALSAESPVSDAMNFELARLVETSTPVAGPYGGAAGIKFIASERTVAEPSVEVAVGTTPAGAAGDADNVSPSLIWRYNYGVLAGAPSGEGVINIGGSDLSGNTGSDGSGRIAIDALGPEPVSGLAVLERSTHSVTLAWPATTDRGAAGEVKDYLVGYSTWTGGLNAAGAGLTVPAGAGLNAALAGLSPGATYYAAVWVRDTLGNVSEVSNAVSTVTLGFGISADGLASIVTPGINMTVETLPPDSPPAVPAFAVMPAAGLEPAQGGIYELLPSGKVFEQPAKLTFYFDPAAVSTDTLSIYYFDGVAWTSASVTGQTFGLLPDGRGYVEGYIAHSSLYALLYRLDVQPPRSAAVPAAFYRAADGTVYVTGRDTFTLTSADDRITSGDGDGYGVLQQALKVSGSGSSRETRFFNASPARGVVFVSTFVLSGEADGFYTLNYNAADVFANAETPKSGIFAVDNTPPAVSRGVEGPSYAAPEAVYAGSGARFTLAGIDANVGGVASGLKEVTYKLDDGAWKDYAGALAVSQLSEGPHVLSYYARDNAGNKAAVADLPLTADFTPPMTYAAFEGSAGHNGWFLSQVGVALNATDSGSGVAGVLHVLDTAGEVPYAGALSVEAEGVHNLRYHASDKVGNAEAWKTKELKIDRTAPDVAAAASRSPNAVGWYNAPVFVNFTGADAVSGIDYCVKGSTLASEGAGKSVSGYCMDYAGWASTATLVVNMDTTAPKVDYTETPAFNAAGWHNTPVEVSFSGTDALSGIDYCSPAVAAASEGAGVELPGSCVDKAGNAGSVTVRLNIDMTVPVLGIVSPLAGQTYIATRGDIRIDFNIKDNLDSAPFAEAYLVQLEDKGSPRGARPAKVEVVAGQSIEPLDIDDGLWRLEVSATDAAGNTAAMQGGTFEVIHDMLAPRSSLSQAGPAYKPAGPTYLTSAAVFTVSSLDDLVAAGDGLGLGVVSQGIKLNAGATLVKELAFANARPAQGEAFVSTFGFAGLPDGLYGLSYGARDVLSNVEPAKDWAFALDNTPPMTQYSVNGVAYMSGGKLYLNSSASIGLAGVDVSSGGVASGLMAVKLKLGDGAWGIYSSTFSIAASGAHTLRYQSLDNVQNAEALQSLNIVIDNAAPTVSASVGEPQYEVFGLRIIAPDTPVVLSAADPGETGLTSGVKTVYYGLIDASGGSSGARSYTDPVKIAVPGTYMLRYHAEDNVGNASLPQELRLMVSGLQGDALDAVAGLEVAGSADIAGAVKSNGVVSLAGNARILGDVTASTITATGSAQITGQRVAGAATLVPEPLSMPVFVEIASNTNSNALIPAKYLQGGKLTLTSKAELILSTGVYYFSGIDLKGGSSVVLNGKVDILVAGEVSIAGGSAFNAAGPSSRLNLFVSTASTLGFAGGGSLAAYVYAPYAELKLTGNALLGGHYFVRNAFISGNGNIVQAGEALPAAVPATGGGGKKVSALGGGTYSVLAGPDPEFKSGEVYVYPNPAKGGQVPTLHIECGIADSVNIKIYTVSGREAHSAVITSLPVALDDGNGLSYAYEYAWRSHIPSGVYYYAIEAEKAGKKIKKTGKFAVVR